MKREKKTPTIDVSICVGVLRAVFDECDRYDHDETGGRVLGTFQRGRDGTLAIRVNGVIEAGPSARRSNSSFFQDGEYQEQVFRHIERTHPDVEHLGNWHTHHVNGYPTLSGGDIATYQRIVNHPKHNLDFFYALLVVGRNPEGSSLNRYHARHYVLFRGDDRVHEVDFERVSVTDESVIWPTDTELVRPTPSPGDTIRPKDKATMERLYPEIRPYQSTRTNTFYWRGTVRLIDDTVVQLTIPELRDDEQEIKPFYQVLSKDTPKACAKIAEQIGKQHFQSAAEAVYHFEQKMNRMLYRTVLQVDTEAIWKS